MDTVHFAPGMRRYLILFFVLLIAVCMVHGAEADLAAMPGPALYLNFNEEGGDTALDASGHFNPGIILGATRTRTGMCWGALLFNGTGEYVSIPSTPLNHPQQNITVSTWFWVDSYNPQTLVSTYQNGGYWLGFGDGNDLWWTINTGHSGVVSVPVLHEGIALRQWHHVTGTYDGTSSKIYLDGSLRNRANASGPLHYEYQNSIILGADAGEEQTPDSSCPRFLKGGLDDVRIYDTALTYSEVMEDRFRCSAEPGKIPRALENETFPLPPCLSSSGTLELGQGASATRTLLFSDITENGTWSVSVPPGSVLVVMARDLYSSSYPDAWYVEIADGDRRVDRSIAFPNTNNAPVDGVISSGNATVSIHYFDGKYRFPASVEVTFECHPAPPLPVQVIPKSILSNPGIVIYSLSWATLIAVLVVVVWLHRKKTRRKERAAEAESGCDPAGTEEKEE
jgi:hypothetical protein